MKITRLGNYIFEKGDYVEISKYHPLSKYGCVGRVVSVDGGYVYLKLIGQDFECEFYHGELEPALSYLRKLKLKKLKLV